MVSVLRNFKSYTTSAYLKSKITEFKKASKDFTKTWSWIGFESQLSDCDSCIHWAIKFN